MRRSAAGCSAGTVEQGARASLGLTDGCSAWPAGNAWAGCLVGALWFLLGIPAASAAPRTLALASGDCEDVALHTASGAFVRSLKERLGTQLLAADAALQQLKPQPTTSVEELQRQLALAQSQFYGLQYFQAEKQAEQALRGIELLPPGGERAELQATARLLLGLVRLGRGRPVQADEAFLQVLRVDPKRQLDPEYFSPSTRDRFEQLRRKVAKLRTAVLQVQSSPSGADVFLDGTPVGKTPYVGKLMPGRYQLQLIKGAQTSFARPLELSATGDESVRVDLQFEGAVMPGEPLCLAAPPGGERTSVAGEPLAMAARLGALLDLQEVVTVRVRKNAAGADWLTASLLNVNGAQEVREGGMKIQAGQFDDLVSFITTGRAGPAVVVAGESKRTPPWAPDSPRAEASSVPGLGEQATGREVGGPLGAAESGPGESVSRSLSEGARTQVEPAAAPVYTRWWFWTGAGVVAAGTAAAVVMFVLPVRCPGAGEGRGCIDVSVPVGAR